MTERSPSLSELLIEAIEARLAELHTGLPAKVVSFDAEKQTCDVQPLLVRVILNDDNEEEPERYPQIQNVPIIYPGAGGWSLIFPLLADDIVFLTFAERSLDRWLEGDAGQEIDPEHNRKHDLSDAVCVPGIRPRTLPIKPLASVGETVRLGHEDGAPAIVLKPDGTIEIGEGATESLVLGEALVAALAAHTHPFVGLPPMTAGMTAPTTEDFSGALSEKGKVL